MSAFVFIILALGYLSASEAKEQLSLSDFLLDFLLSLWVPSNYVPSKATQNFPDPEVREQLISVEKSRSALDNYIRHLLRYATENPKDNSQVNLLGDLTPDSSQLFVNGLPVRCNSQNYRCNFVDLNPNQVYAGSELVPAQAVPYPVTMANAGVIPGQPMLPPQTIYPNPGPLPNLAITPNQGLLYSQNIHSGHYHQNEFIPSHIHTPKLEQVELDDDDSDSYSDWTPESVSKSIASLFPDFIGQSANIFVDYNDEDVPDCDPNDPNVDPARYNPAYCAPAEEVPQPYLYRGIKRNVPRFDDARRRHSISGWYHNPMAQPAHKILYLAKDKNRPKGMARPRMLGAALVQQPGTLADIPPDPDASVENYDKNKRENNIASDRAKEVEYKIFQDWYLPNFLDDVLRNPYTYKLEPSFTGVGSEYYDDQFNEYTDAFVANRIVDEKLNPKGSLFKDLASPARLTPDLGSLIRLNPTSSANKNSNKNEDQGSLLKRSLLPAKKKTSA